MGTKFKLFNSILYTYMFKILHNLNSPRLVAQHIRTAGNREAISHKNKFRINLKSFEMSELKETCEAIKNIAIETGAIISGPVPLPMKKKVYCVLRSPHVNKDSREHFEIRTYSRVFEIKRWSPDTVDRLMVYEVPSGVDVNVKL